MRTKEYIQHLRLFIVNIGQKGLFNLLTSNALIQIVGFGSQLFVAWKLSPDDLGRIKVLQSFIALAIIPAGFGMNSSVLKLCSEDRDDAEKKYIYNTAYHYTFFSVCAIYIIMIAAALTGMLSKDAAVNHSMYVYALMIFPLSFLAIDMAYLQAIKQIKIISSVQIWTKSVTVLLVILGTVAGGLAGYIFAIIVGTSLTNIALGFKTRALERSIIFKGDRTTFSTHWFYAKYSLLSNLVTQLLGYLDIFIINYLVLDRMAVGYYSFALTLMIGLQVITATIQQIVTPYFSQKSSDFREWERVYQKYSRIFFWMSACLTIGCLLMIPSLLTYLFAGKYAQSIVFVQLLTISWFVRNLFSIKGVAIFGLGKIKLNFYSVLISLPINITLTYLGTRYWSLPGAAVSMILGNFVTYLVVSWQLRHIRYKNRAGVEAA